MKIPKRLKIMGHTIEIVMKSDLAAERDLIGQMQSNINTIFLQPNLPGKPMAEEMIEQTFLHELVHNILYLGFDKYEITSKTLRADEHFVDLFAQLLYQALSTMEYPNEPTERT